MSVEPGPVLQFSFPCEGFRADPGGGLSVDRIVDTFSLPKQRPHDPFSGRGMIVINGWAGGPAEFQEHIEITGPDGSVVMKSEERLCRLRDQRERAVSIYQFANPAREPGEHRLRVYRDGAEVLCYVLTFRPRGER